MVILIKKDEYVLKITNASKVQLVIINFELIIDYINEAKKNLQSEKDFSFYIDKARQFLRELSASLNMDYEISYTFLSLYHYVDERLAKFLFNKSIETADEALKILIGLKEAWEQVKEEDTSPVMKNVEQMYAGLTYSKNGKLAEYVDTSANRGFKA